VANGVSKKKVPISEAELQNWKLLETFQNRLEPLLAQSGLSAEHQKSVGRYLSLMLFGLLNPALKSARSLCAASVLDRMQREVCHEPVQLTRFSEMQHVCDPQLLAGLLQDLGQEAMPVFGDDTLRAKVKDLIANDGTLLPALPRMSWALWQNAQNRAGKLHLEFSVWRQVPSEFTVTAANKCERVVWKEKLKPGAFYVNDRAYSHDYQLILHLQKTGASFVLRLQNNALIERLGPARALSEADRQAGVVEDVQVKLGSGAEGPVGRLVRVEADGHTFLLFTDRDDLEAEMVALIYRYRWQVELFFKWIKCILGCRHWMAESQTGVTLQVYCALIASVLLVLWTGRKPTKRQWEALQLYWMGWATLEELTKILTPAKKLA
jgi:hypothetical protein